MHYASAGEGLEQVFAEAAFVTDDERAQDGGSLAVKVSIEKRPDSPAGLFDPAADTTATRALVFDRRIVPEKRREIDPLPGQVALVVKAAWSMKIAWHAQVQGQAQHIAVLPRAGEPPHRRRHPRSAAQTQHVAVLPGAREGMHGHQDFACSGTQRSILPHAQRLQVQPPTMRESLGLAEEPALDRDLLGKGEVTEVCGREVGRDDALQGSVGQRESKEQARDKRSQPATAAEPGSNG